MFNVKKWTLFEATTPDQEQPMRTGHVWPLDPHGADKDEKATP